MNTPSNLQFWTRRHVSDQDDISVTVTETAPGMFQVDVDHRNFHHEEATPTSSLETAKAAGDALVQGYEFSHVCTSACTEWKRLK